MTSKYTKLNAEFCEFADIKSLECSTSVNSSLLAKVKSDLNPHPAGIFAKLTAIQVVMGLVTLLFCPQFGIGLTDEHRIMHVFMQFGSVACSFLCGSLFVGSTLIILPFFLSWDEVRVLRTQRTIQIGALSLVASFIFALFGGDVFEVLTVIWILGAMIGGIVSLEMGRIGRIIGQRAMYA